MPYDSDMERPLDLLETFLWKLDRVGALNFVTYANVAGEFTEDQFRLGLAAVQARHPLLRVRIEVRGGRRGYFRLGAPSIAFRIVDLPEERWPAELEYELNTQVPFDPGPLMRVAVLRHSKDRCKILLAFNHAIGDGMSGVYVMRDLILATGRICEGRDPGLEPLPPPPSLYAGFPASMRGLGGWKALLQFIGGFIRETRQEGPPRAPKLDGYAPIARRWACSIPHYFDEGFSRTVAARARSEKTTIHGALSAALARATAECIDAQEPVRLLFTFPLNLRRQIVPPAGLDCGAFASSVAICPTIDPRTPFWDLARALRQKLRDSTLAGQQFFTVPCWWKLYSFLADIWPSPRSGAARFESFLAAVPPPIATLSFSNVDLLDIERNHGPLRIECMGSGWAMGGLGLLASTSARLNGVLSWNIGGMSPLMSREHITQVADRAKAILREAV